MMTSISFHLDNLGNRRRVFATHAIKSRVGKLKTEFSLKIFAHPGLNPCRRPWQIGVRDFKYVGKICRYA